MWCPKCKAEYRDGITICADCGCPLVKDLPVEIDSTPAEDKAKILSQIDSHENLQSLSDGTKAYVEMETKYEDMKSTAYSFILVGAAGIILMLFMFVGIIPLQFAAYMKRIMKIINIIRDIKLIIIIKLYDVFSFSCHWYPFLYAAWQLKITGKKRSRRKRNSENMVF